MCDQQGLDFGDVFRSEAEVARAVRLPGEADRTQATNEFQTGSVRRYVFFVAQAL
jgi:hypothetical protein